MADLIRVTRNTWSGVRRLFSLTVVLAVMAGIVLPGPAASGAESRTVPDAVARARAYWSAKKMQAARPMPLPVASRSGTKARWRDAGDRVGYVAPTAPRESASATEVPHALQLEQPLSTNGKVFFTDPATGYNYVCSGTALSSNNMSTVWSAGHCAFDKGYFTNWVFVPAYRDGHAPFGVWPAIEMHVPQQWLTSYNLSYDFAAAVVAPAGDGSRLVDVVGGRGFMWNAPTELTFDAYGYPAASPFSGGRMHSCASAYAGGDDPPGTGPHTMSIVCDMTGGSSGGGWVVAGALNSNVSYGKQSSPGRLFGPYLGDTAAATYQAASTSAAPGPTPSPAPTPTVTPTPTPSPSATATPTPAPSPSATATPTPAPSPPATATPTPTPSPSATATPTPSPSPSGSPTPPASPSPTPSLPEIDPGPSPSPSADDPPVVAPLLTDARVGPDPFSPDGDGRRDQTRLRFRTTEASIVTVVVKKNGRRVRALRSGAILAPGRHRVRWDGRSESGRLVRAGRYVFVIKADPLFGERAKLRDTVRVNR